MTNPLPTHPTMSVIIQAVVDNVGSVAPSTRQEVELQETQLEEVLGFTTKTDQGGGTEIRTERLNCWTRWFGFTEIVDR